MTIFTGGKSTAINSPRHLTLRHTRRAVKSKKLSLGILPADEVDNEIDLKPGEEKLNSYWAPGLEAGAVHTVAVSQTIDPNNEEKPLELSAKQDFSVDAPQFSLPEGSIHSIYPPAGYSDDHRILPHVVLTDPHLPWERRGSPKTPVKKSDRNRVPWLALLSFTQDELRLTPEAFGGVKQTSTLAVSMTVGDLMNNENITSPVTTKLGPNIEHSRGDFIFIKPELFRNFFSTFDSSNKRLDSTIPDTSQYKFLSHVRKINTTGMAISGVEDVGIFSIVVGNRSGTLDNTVATSVVVHLVSIEGVEEMTLPITSSYVALCSLHSWNYTVMAPGMLNVHDAFVSLGETLGVLRPPDKDLELLRPGSRLQERMASRLEDGYSLVKNRTQTGEPTVALFRGPFTPTVVPRREMNDCSNSGLDLQILDKEVGILDITYSSAWQLGRVLALGDQTFTAALSRLRSTIHKRAMIKSKMIIVKSQSKNSIRTREDVLGDLPDMVKHLTQIHVMTPYNSHSRMRRLPFRPGGPLKRWHRPRLQKADIPDLAFSAEHVQDKYLGQAIEATRVLAKATDQTVYDETNDPVSTDWMIVLAWVMNRMFLAGLPAHYLITDPSHLGHESLRFFYIDSNWVDAMIDGALSLGSHMPIDIDRVAIKTAINDYITHVPQHQTYAPQIPTYGFFLRSDLVTMFPDLRVSTLPPAKDPPDRAPLLRHEIVTDGVMLGLLDRVPNSEDFNGIVFTQPPHQQRFAVAARLGLDDIKINMRRQYTVDQETREKDPSRHLALDIKNLPKERNDPDNVFIWGSVPDQKDLNDLRILRLPHFADAQLKALTENMGTYFSDDAATSALFAMQLNDPFYNLTVNLTKPMTKRALRGLKPPVGGAEMSTPRTLRRLKPSRVKILTESYSPAEDDDDPRVEPDHDALAAMTSFQRPDSYKPGPQISANLAPHIRTIPVETSYAPTPPSHDTASLISTVYDLPAGAPTYECDVYTAGSYSIKIGDGLAQDLIFSIVARNNENSSYRLKEFNITIPFGDPDSGTCLMHSYDGPGPSMLSNLRFNVLASLLGNESLLLRLLPRSAENAIDIKRVSEMGFLLCLAKVNSFPKSSTLLTLKTSAIYQSGQTIDGSFVIVIDKSI